MTILFSGSKTEATPYKWEYVYRIDGLGEWLEYDYVYSNIDKPLGEGITRGTLLHPDDIEGIPVVAALYYQDRVLCGRLFQT
jgi:hypothetical protein